MADSLWARLEERFDEYSSLPSVEAAARDDDDDAEFGQRHTDATFKVSKRIMCEIKTSNQFRQPKQVEATVRWREISEGHLPPPVSPAARVGMSLTRLGWGAAARLVLYGGFDEAGFAPEPLPRWARDACAAAAASDPSLSRPVPNHVLVNSYDFSKESYVLPHTDGPAYDDRTFTLSCGADAVVVFKERLKTSDIGVRAAATRCEVLLRRRSLLAFSREAYTECTHEIGAAPDTIGPRCANLGAANARVGDVVGRAGERVSFTLRCAGGAE